MSTGKNGLGLSSSRGRFAMALAAGVVCMFSAGQANAFETNTLNLVDNGSGAYAYQLSGGLLDNAPRWDSVDSVSGVGRNRSLVGGLGYNFEGGNLTTYMQQFSFAAGVQQIDFNLAVDAAFKAWSSRDSFVRFTKTNDPVWGYYDLSNQPVNQITGNEIDFFGSDLAMSSLALTWIWGVDEKVRLTNGFSPDGTGLFPSTRIYSSDVVINDKNVVWQAGHLERVDWTIEAWQATFTHELGHALGLGDVEGQHFFDDDVVDPFLPNNGLVVNDAMTINEAGDVRRLLSDWGQPCGRGTADAQCAGILMRSEFTGLLALAPDDVAGLRFLYPVPEPDTYAMLLAGLGLLALVARRRKQSEAATG